ncbi:uncharacterized protein LOC144100407 [Amblyomma americanum]
MHAASTYKKTTLGVAFAFQHTTQLGNDLRRIKPNLLDVFWQSGIFHTGILDTPEGATRTQVMTAVLRLKDLDGLSHTQTAMRHRALTALAAPSPGRQWIYLLDEEFKRLQFIPDLLIMYGHYPFGDSTVANCAVVPPTRLSAPPLPPQFRGSYLYDLSVGPQAVLELQRRQVTTHALLSVTMKGRWTMAAQGEPLEFFSRCERNPGAESFGSYTQVCTARNYVSNLRYQPQHYAMLTYDNNRTMFAYDNEVGLASKLCKVKNEARDLTFGIAVYDVDYDDYANVCRSLNKFRGHSRLKALRKIVDYYRNLANHIFNETLCTAAAS